MTTAHTANPAVPAAQETTPPAPSQQDNPWRRYASLLPTAADEDPAESLAGLFGEAPEPDRVDAVVPPPPDEDDGIGRFPFITDRDIRSRTPAPDLVDGLLTVGTVNQLFAPKNHFKTFLAIDLGYSIASGQPTFLGQQIRRHGSVAYLCAEGGGRLGVRAQAWCDANGIEGYVDRVAIFPQPVNLLDVGDYQTDPRSTLQRIIHTLRREHPSLALLVVDTLSQNAPGIEENSSRDMSRLLEACQYLQRKLKTTVLVLHHPTKSDSTIERGSSAFTGGCANVLFVRQERGQYYLGTKYIRDGGALPEIQFEAVTVEVPRYRDAEDRPLTSCVIRPILTEEDRTTAQREIAGWEAQLLSGLQQAGPGGLSGADVVQLSKKRRKTVFDLLKDLEKQKKVRSTGRGRSQRWMIAAVDGERAA